MKRVSKKAKPVAPPAKKSVLYKVVELSNVDEVALERTVNEWCSKGWSFDGVQFAMRESSKRPAMGFVFFTREGAPVPDPVELESTTYRSAEEANIHFKRLASASAWDRLEALAQEVGEE
jgi:hypothetical protein